MIIKLLFLLSSMLLLQTTTLSSQDIAENFYYIKFGDIIENPNKIKKIELTEYHRFFQIRGAKSIFYYDTLGRMTKYYIHGKHTSELKEFHYINTDTTTIKISTLSNVNKNIITNTSEFTTIFKYKYRKLHEIQYFTKCHEGTKNKNFFFSDTSIIYEEYFNGFTYLHTYTYKHDKYCNCKAVVKKEVLIKIPQYIDTTDNSLYRISSYDRDLYIFNSDGILTDIIRISKSGFIGVPYIEENGVGVSHIKFTDFDKHGNWTRSYFILGNRKKFISKRKITYCE